MSIDNICILISSLSFFAYALSYFMSSHVKNEFKRFGIEKLGLLVIVLEFLGAAGLLVGLIFNPILIISSLGLALLMLSGLIVRMMVKDSLWISLPALFFMVLNIYIFWSSIQ
jgi:hypothetical protein